MRLKLNLSGITAELSITGYVPDSADWCKSDFVFRSEDWLNYHGENRELFTAFDLEYLVRHLWELVRGEMQEVTSYWCFEPDFTFVMMPAREVQSQPGLIILNEDKSVGSRFYDICMEWRVGFWYRGHGFSGNYLSLDMGAQEVRYFLAYLELVMGKRTEEDREIAEMMEKGILVP